VFHCSLKLGPSDFGRDETEGVREQGAEENIKRKGLTGGWRELRNG
jgi:hypothetical protein